MVTHDFLVIGDDGVQFVECKPSSVLEKKRKKNPTRYFVDEEGQWQCAASKQDASTLGFEHRIVTEKSLSQKLVRNADILKSHVLQMDYAFEPASQARDNVGIPPSIEIMTLFELYEQVGQDVALQGILAGRWFVDLENSLLIHPERVWVYFNKNKMLIQRKLSDCRRIIVENIYDLESARTVFWDGNSWDIVNFNVTSKAITLCSSSSVLRLEGDELEKLIAKRAFSKSSPSSQAVINEKLIHAKDADIEEMLRRAEMVNGKNSSASVRTVQRYKRSFFEAEEDFGNGLVGLLPRHPAKGNRTRRLCDDTEALMKKIIEKKYLKKNGGSVRNSYILYLAIARRMNLQEVTYNTFHSRVTKICQRRRVSLREGVKAAYQMAPAGRLEIEESRPPDGDFAFQIAHIDSTPIELSMVSSINGKAIGSLWLTVMVDAYSRHPLAFTLSPHKPSFRTIMELIMKCSKRWSRLPLTLVVDQGSEHKNTYLQQLCASLEITLFYRAASAARVGAPVERLFGTSQQQLIHQLEGNRKNIKMGRGKSPSHDPQKQALWSPTEFSRVLEHWAFYVYPGLTHSTTAESPAERLARSDGKFHRKPGVPATWNEDFEFLLLPSPKTGPRTITVRGVTMYGISYQFTRPVNPERLPKEKVLMKYNPFNLSYCYVQINGFWERLVTNNPIVREFIEVGFPPTEMEIIPLLRKQKSEYASVQDIQIEFVSEVEDFEREISKGQAVLEHANKHRDEVPCRRNLHAPRPIDTNSLPLADEL
jgi:transposase InsO family protein